MANGPFGNPLTTGIALTFDVDMTPYDNMLKRNAAKAAEKAKADKDLLDKYNEYAKNITVDFDKIHWRLHDKARAKYAETLAELNKAVMNKDVHAANMLMMDSKQFNYNLVQRTSEWNEIFNQDPTKVYYDPSIQQKINDRSIPSEDTQITEIFTKYGTPDELLGSLQKAPSRRNLKTDVDNLLKGAERRLQPGDKPTMYLPTGEAVYEPKYTNKDEVRNQVIMDYTSPQNIESTIYMLMEDYGMSPSELQGKDIPETQEKLTAAIDRVFDPIWSSIESEQFKSRPPRETTKPSYTFGEDSIGDVAFSGTTPSGITSEAPTPEQEQQALTNELTSTIQKYLEDAKAADPNNVEDELIDQKITDNFLSNYGLKMEVPFTYGEQVEVLTEGGTSLGVLDPTSQSFVQDLTNIVLEKGSEVKEKTPNVTPETTVEEFLKPESNAFTVQMAGGKTPKTDWSIPGGTTVILAGDQGAVEVKLKNDMTFEKGKFQKAAKYKDKSGDTDTYYDIMFPIDQRDKELYFTNLFNDSDVLTEFKTKSPDQLPKSMYIKEDENTFNTLLSILQTRETKGKMNNSVLKKAMDKYMKPLSESGTQSSESSGETISLQDLPTGAKVEQKNGKYYYNGKEVLM